MKPNFLWGSATSSHQIEGGNRFNDWWQWEEQGNIEGGARSGSATDHWNRFRDDLKLAAELGSNSYRFSIEWSRIEPEEGKWNLEALEWYRELVSECERLNLLPMATLHHFTIPQWVACQGGITWQHFPDRFGGFVRKVIATIGARVPLWCTINEPNSLALGQYLAGFMPPAECNPEKAALGTRNLFLAHVRAYDLLHRKITERTGPFKDYPFRVGFAHNMIRFMPYSRSPIEWALSKVIDRFYNGAWIDAVMGRRQHFGVSGLIPSPKPVWEGRGRRTADFIGVNYYMKVYVVWGPQKSSAEFIKFKSLPLGIIFSRPEDTVSDLGWAVYPEGLYEILVRLKSTGLPLYITENGVADSADRVRPQFLKSHVDAMMKAKREGVPVEGYFHWSLIDNFEWVKGFGPRFGLFEVDYQNFERHPRASTGLFKEIVMNN